MDWATYEAILGSLGLHGYEGWLAFHNYNEPLANPRIVREISTASGRLPRAQLTIYTNGDLLTAELFNALVAARLTEMRVTVYPNASCDAAPSHAQLWKWLKRKPFLPAADCREVFLRQGPALVLDAPIAMQLISPDVSRYYDRGGTIPSLSIARRVSPCLLTSHSLSIDYRGDIKMCCNVISGHAPHDRYILGNVLTWDPVEAWNSARFTELRALHRGAQWTATPICTTCRQEIPAS